MIVLDLTPVYSKEHDYWMVGKKAISNQALKSYKGNIKDLILLLHDEGWTPHEAAAVGLLLKTKQ